MPDQQQEMFPGFRSPKARQVRRKIGVQPGPQAQAQQQQLPFQAPGIRVGPETAVRSPFTQSGLGKYLGRDHTNGLQFNKPAIKQATEDSFNAFTRGQYFRHAGMGQAIRYTLGVEQVPSHVNDWINARNSAQRGIHPGEVRMPGPPSYWGGD